MNQFPRGLFRIAVSLLLAGATAKGVELLSVDAGGTKSGNAGVGENFCISPDGRYVAFNSISTNLVVPDTNGGFNVFVRDCILRSNIWSTIDPRGATPGPGPIPLQFAADGRFLLFSSRNTNLAPNLFDFTVTQLFRRDLWSNETALVSVAYDGTNGALKACSVSPARPRVQCMTPDGRFILYSSAATNLVAGVNSGTLSFAYLRDMSGATNELITASPAGLAPDRAIAQCLMSTNARYFAFDTAATNVTPGLTNTSGLSQVYWRDRLAGTNVLVSVDVNGNFAAKSATLNSLTRDGRFVCFSTLTTNIVTEQNDFNATLDLFIRDMVLGETWLVSRATNGNTTAGRVQGGEFSADGRWMLVAPSASDIVPGVSAFSSTGSTRDLCLHDVTARTNLMVSRSVSGLTGASGFLSDTFATVSASGRFVVFDTTSTNLLSGGTTAVSRLLLRDTGAGKTVSTLPGAYVAPAYNYGHYAISEDERYVYFMASGVYDPTLTDANNGPDIFRARLLPAQLRAPSPGGPIQGEGLALGTYILQTSSNLTTWFNAATNVADSNGVFSVSDPQPPGPQRYFRLVTP